MKKIKHPIKCVIFDLDGTIFDSEVIWKEKSVVISKKYNIDIDFPFRKKICGAKEEEEVKIMHKRFPNIDAKKVRGEWCKLVYDEIEKNGVELKKGFLPLKSYFKENGYRIALATGAREESIKKRFAQHNMDPNEIFDQIVTCADVKKGKPSPQVYKFTCKKLNLKPKNCLVIEDSPNGAKSAIRAGIPTIIVPDVFPPARYEKRHAVAILPDLDAVKSFLQSLAAFEKPAP